MTRRAALLGLMALIGWPAALAGEEPGERPQPAWKSLPIVKPVGEQASTGSYTVKDRAQANWTKPAFVYNQWAATGRKHAKVVVVIYNPVLESQGGKPLIELLGANDPVEFSHILANVIREASWGYINYEIVDVLTIDGYPTKIDGFCYTDESYTETRKTQDWQPSPASYRKIFEENNLIQRCRDEKITEVWLWGATGMHFDEFAGYIPNRYARFGPTDNPWFYRPYDIPEEIGHTMWVMGFNYEVGADNMIHSYTHRVESMAALGPADGIWDPPNQRDPWNVFSWLEMDHGTPSHVGNCHVPPNGERGYDYNNPRRVLSWADCWARYPDLRGQTRQVSSAEWGHNQFGYQKWILEHVPKYPGHTEYGYNNWWVYIANTDEDLPDWERPDPSRFVLPEGMPPLRSQSSANRPRPRQPRLVGGLRFASAIIQEGTGDRTELPFPVALSALSDVEVADGKLHAGRIAGPRSSFEAQPGTTAVSEFLLPDGHRLFQLRCHAQQANRLANAVFNYAALATSRYLVNDDVAGQYPLAGYYAIVRRDGQEFIELFITGEVGSAEYPGVLDFKHIEPEDLLQDDAVIGLLFYVTPGVHMGRVENQRRQGAQFVIPGYKMGN